MKKSQKLILATGLVLSVFLISFVLAVVPTECSGGKCYRIDHGETIEEVSLVSVVYDIINQHSSNNYFIPTNTEGEFSAFKTVASSLSVLFSEHVYCVPQTSCSDSECGSSISDGCGGTITCPACPVTVINTLCTECSGQCGEQGYRVCTTYYSNGTSVTNPPTTCLMPACLECDPPCDSCSTCNGNLGECLSSCSSEQECCDGTCYNKDPCYSCGLYLCTSSQTCTSYGCKQNCAPCYTMDSYGDCNYQCESNEECINGECQLYLPLADDGDSGPTAEEICAAMNCGDCENCNPLTLSCESFCATWEECWYGVCI
jgi:hypothetical protein